MKEEGTAEKASREVQFDWGDEKKKKHIRK
jgi:hypothetical protein